ncbi:MAG: hypothetical protein ACLFR7_12435 [Opitutales bacterium]
MPPDDTRGKAIGVYCQPGNNYTRLYLTADKAHYSGICYKCGTCLRVRAGPQGWDTKRLQIICPRPPPLSPY